MVNKSIKQTYNYYIVTESNYSVILEQIAKGDNCSIKKCHGTNR